MYDIVSLKKCSTYLDKNVSFYLIDSYNLQVLQTKLCYTLLNEDQITTFSTLHNVIVYKLTNIMMSYSNR